MCTFLPSRSSKQIRPEKARTGARIAEIRKAVVSKLFYLQPGERIRQNNEQSQRKEDWYDSGRTYRRRQWSGVRIFRQWKRGLRAGTAGSNRNAQKSLTSFWCGGRHFQRRDEKNLPALISKEKRFRGAPSPPIPASYPHTGNFQRYGLF